MLINAIVVVPSHQILFSTVKYWLLPSMQCCHLVDKLISAKAHVRAEHTEYTWFEKSDCASTVCAYYCMLVMKSAPRTVAYV